MQPRNTHLTKGMSTRVYTFIYIYIYIHVPFFTGSSGMWVVDYLGLKVGVDQVGYGGCMVE